MHNVGNCNMGMRAANGRGILGIFSHHQAYQVTDCLVTEREQHA